MCVELVVLLVSVYLYIFKQRLLGVNMAEQGVTDSLGGLYDAEDVAVAEAEAKPAKKTTMIPCGTCGAYNDAFSVFCIFCSRRLDRSAARAHKFMTQAAAGTRLSQKVIEGLYYHFAFQNFRIRDIITHDTDRKDFMESLGLEDDPRMQKVFDDFDRRKEESLDFLGKK